MVKITLHTNGGYIEKIVPQSEIKATIEWLRDSGLEGKISVEPVE